MLHELKIHPKYFNEILINNKTFEIRKDDWLYQVGDYLLLQEYLSAGVYSGKEILAKVLYVYRGELCLQDYCIMAIEVLDWWPVRFSSGLYFCS